MHVETYFQLCVAYMQLTVPGEIFMRTAAWHIYILWLLAILYKRMVK